MTMNGTAMMPGGIDATRHFEQGRIKALQDERVYIQKRTFTRWMNSFLAKANMEVNDLFTDLADGRMLMKLLEIISGAKLGRFNKGQMRVHKVENLNKSLKYLSSKVRLESIGAEDIVDGNPRLILGLIWTIILRFQIQEIEVDLDEEDEHSEKKQAKEALLLWCKRKTAGYRGVNITDFSGSWRNGLGFNALIHHHRPDVFDYDKLNPADHIENLNNAFDVAEEKLGIARLLDAEDIDVSRPDEKSVLTYIASYYHTFARMKEGVTGSKRIGKIINKLRDIDNEKNKYENLASNLVEWINKKIVALNDRRFPNTLDGIQAEIIKFKEYRTVEKPPRLEDKGNLEVCFFNIQTKLKAEGRKNYVPRDGRLLHDIEKAWTALEKAEHKRELALREELMRQEKLEQLAEKFERKAALRDGWLEDMFHVLKEMDIGTNTSHVELTAKRHETIGAEVLNRKDRFHMLSVMARDLIQNNYHGGQRIKDMSQLITEKWNNLLEQLQRRKAMLAGVQNLTGILRDIESLQAEIKQLQNAVSSKECGKHLLGVENLLHKHNLIESEVSSQGECVTAIAKKAQPYAKMALSDGGVLNKKLDNVKESIAKLQEQTAKRKLMLQEAHKFFQFIEDSEEEESWVLEKQRLAKSQDVGSSLQGVVSLQQKHEALEAEMQARWPKCQSTCENGQAVIDSHHPASADINKRIISLKQMWQKLKELMAARKTKLDDAAESHQYYSDANEADSWIKEKMPLASSQDYGRDANSAQSLLQRHGYLEEEISAYHEDIQRLNQLATLMTKDAQHHNITPDRTVRKKENEGEEEDEEEKTEMVDVPYEVEVEEVQEREVTREVVEDVLVPRVRGIYHYRGHGMAMDKGEVLWLRNNSNKEWWNVQSLDGTKKGFVPATYVTEIEPAMKTMRVKKPVMERVVVKTPKLMFRKEPRKKGRVARRTPSIRSSKNLHFDKDNLEIRQAHINEHYRKLCELSKLRRHGLEEAIQLYNFHREASDFDDWMKEKAKLLTASDDGKEKPEVRKKKFEKLMTDVQANASRPQDIGEMAEKIIKHSPRKEQPVRRRQAELEKSWADLCNLCHAQQKALEGELCVDQFALTANELRDWIQDKQQAMGEDGDLGQDLKSVKTLQRKHQNLERDLAPVQDQLKTLHELGEAVKSNYPNQSSHVNSKLKDITDMWKELNDKANKRKSGLEDSHGQQLFTDEIAGLLQWSDSVLNRMKIDEPANDVLSAEEQVREHDGLLTEIKANDDRLNYARSLGNKLLSKSPANCNEINSALHALDTAQNNMDEAWQNKRSRLIDNLDLQLVNREANRADAGTNSHEAFLDMSDLGKSVDDVKALIKRHQEFADKLNTQDAHLDILNEMANKLIHVGHPDSDYIDQRRKKAIEKRQAVKNKAKARMQDLEASLDFLEFKRDAEELSSWINEKEELVVDDSYKDPSNLLRKVQKHEAFVAELHANSDRLDTINQMGHALQQSNHFASPEVTEIVHNLNEQWNKLCKRAQEKGAKLDQASQQRNLNRILDDSRSRLNEMEVILVSEELGRDLRSCKELNQKHQRLEDDMQTDSERIKNIINQGQTMAKGHFDSHAILRSTQEFDERFEKLKAPAKVRKEKLAKALGFHQFIFEINNELQWIKEHMPAATSEEFGKSLIDAQNLHQKYQNFELEVQGHQPIIDKRLAMGQELANNKEPAAREIREKCHELSSEWDKLLDASAARKKKLEMFLLAQQFHSEAAEVESWINEKSRILNSDNCGKDEDAANKLLTKHKALEVEIESYNGIGVDLEAKAAKLCEIDHPENKAITKRQQHLQHMLNNLKKLAVERKRKLEDSKNLFEYLRESGELEQWIREQLQAAKCEDYGQDYEHLQVLQDKFDEFKRRIEAGLERFLQCERLAKELVVAQNPHSADIEEKQDHIKKSWQLLVEQIEDRGTKLRGAGEIHRFNRDVAEALSRIQEKYASIPDDIGRDLNGVKSLMRRHESFENELVALEGQLQVLLDDSARLQQAYPGGNADDIAQQQQIVMDNWKTLQERAAQRKEDLQSACDFHHFLAAARDLISWASEMRNDILTEEPARDMPTAQMLKTKHEQVKAEIDAREDPFSDVVSDGQMMIDKKHFASAEIQEKIDQVLLERERLHESWQKKTIYLAQLVQLHGFLREGKQLNAWSATQEAKLASGELGVTVDEVGDLLKKHEAFEKVLLTQEEKLAILHDNAQRLIAQKHYASKQIKNDMEEVIARRSRVKDLSGKRKKQLHDAMLYVQFNRDVTEAELWIDEKMKIAQEGYGDVVDLQDKMRKLQKHQAFEAEVSSNERRIRQIKETGDRMISDRHAASAEVRQRMDGLLQKWRLLIQTANNKARGLEEARDILDFHSQVDKAEAWIRDKEMMIQAGETGRDFEHCLLLQKKLNDSESDVTVDEGTINAVNVLADKLVSQGQSDTHSVKQRQQQLNKSWNALKGSLANYRAQLDGALEIHAFNLACDEINERIMEKAKVMSVDDCGKDLDGVQSLQRKHENQEKDMTVISGRITELDKQAKLLSQKFPEMSSKIKEKQSEVRKNWKHLFDLSAERKGALEAAYVLQKFFEDAEELEIWVQDMLSRMNSNEVANNIPEAQNLIELHGERKAEIDGRHKLFVELSLFGNNLINSGHYAKVEIGECVKKFQQMEKTLNDEWQSKSTMLKQCYDLQVFNECADNADSWLQSKEAFVNNEDLGDSKEAVLMLAKKHEGFQKTVEAQEEKVHALELYAEQLCAQKHYDTDGINQRAKMVVDRRNKLKSLSDIRCQKLEESNQLHRFRINVYEVTTWLNEKIQVANDESYRDSTNLQGKIQKHQTFEKEVLANKKQANAVREEGKSLVASNHFASAEIKQHLENVDTMWKELKNAMDKKKGLLQEAYQGLLFHRTVDDLDSWAEEAETQLASEDHGKDLTSVNNLLKKHQQLEGEINIHAAKLQAVKEWCDKLCTAKHFASDELIEKASAIEARYNSLKEPVQIRRDNLEDSMQLHQFYRDVEDEMSWVKEKMPMVNSTDLGSSLTAVQSLQKKHQALQGEIKSHEPLIEAVAQTAEHMSNNKHFASADVETCIHKLLRSVQLLKDAAHDRSKKLLDAVESQTFYAEVSEAQQWISEKKPILTSKDLGKDEDSVQALLRKLEAIDLDIDAFKTNIKRLENLSDGLVKRNHFDKENIAQKQRMTEMQYDQLAQLSAERRHALLDNKNLYEFQREVEDLSSWLHKQMVYAASEDYGKDVEHVEILQQRFESFMRDVLASEDRVQNINRLGEKLLAEQHPNSVHIREACNKVNDQWSGLKDLGQARKEALEGAKQVHTYDRDCDETMEWMQEKNLMLMSSDIGVAGKDLESVQTSLRRHDAFERDLDAVKAEVENICQEAARLSREFPDAEEHITVKKQDTAETLSALLRKAAVWKDKLKQAEQLQAYFADYRELMAWISEMIALITSDELARDVPGAEALITKLHEHEAEINTRMDSFAKFIQLGKQFIREKHFLSDDIQDKVERLNNAVENLLHTLKQRRALYEQNQDAQHFKRDAEQLQLWMRQREAMQNEDDLGQSIHQVEMLIKKHDDFEKTVSAQEERFNAIRRVTMIEQAESNLKEQERQQRQDAERRRNEERHQQIKQREQHRILEERRREHEGRDEQLSHSQLEAEQYKKEKKVKRTPSFTTRRRTTSFRKFKALDKLPPLVKDGVLERKHELQSGGKKATIRSWKTFYTALCGEMLCFFKDKQALEEGQAASGPVIVTKAKVSHAADYTKKKHVFRLQLADGAEYLFMASNDEDMKNWVDKIDYWTAQPPSVITQAPSIHGANSPGQKKEKKSKHWESSSEGSSPEVTNRSGYHPPPSNVPPTSTDVTVNTSPPALPSGPPPPQSVAIPAPEMHYYPPDNNDVKQPMKNINVRPVNGAMEAEDTSISSSHKGKASTLPARTGSVKDDDRKKEKKSGVFGGLFKTSKRDKDHGRREAHHYHQQSQHPREK